MTDTHIAKLMWNAYAIQAGGKTFDGKPLPTWDELGEERQSCWVATASVTAERIEKLEAALQFYVCGCNVRCADFKKNSRCGYTARKALEGKDG
jgi:hypothetical protein